MWIPNLPAGNLRFRPVHEQIQVQNARFQMQMTFAGAIP